MEDFGGEKAETKKDQNKAALEFWVSSFLFGALVMLDERVDEYAFGYVLWVFYFTAGIYLNRSVLRKATDWHPRYYELQHVTSRKIKYLLLWPLAYFVLFFRVGMNRLI
ncbi:hypothetical protein [Marinobacter salarius]|uniref:hypothetical protein n=1 Tax=Marinobacter salarius TaxID=1420917 RepID=UPI0018F10896|nr:hypothetical protein [Marinobacter salarius]MBJ7275322.1 hypothetical protein [Marinobacter salarius]